MHENKGTYFHLGGIAHAALHGLGTFFILLVAPISVTLAIAFGTFDCLVHYHIDWAKVRITKRLSLNPQHSLLWTLFGLDQLLHQLTYCLILFFALSP